MTDDSGTRDPSRVGLLSRKISSSQLFFDEKLKHGRSNDSRLFEDLGTIGPDVLKDKVHLDVLN